MLHFVSWIALQNKMKAISWLWLYGSWIYISTYAITAYPYYDIISYWLMVRNIEVTISNGQSRDTYKQTLEKTEGPIKNGQSRETGIVRCTRRKTKLGTGHITKTNKPQTTTQKSKNMGNADPTNQSGEPRNPGSRKSKQFLFLIRYVQCDSYS